MLVEEGLMVQGEKGGIIGNSTSTEPQLNEMEEKGDGGKGDDVLDSNDSREIDNNDESKDVGSSSGENENPTGSKSPVVEVKQERMDFMDVSDIQNSSSNSTAAPQMKKPKLDVQDNDDKDTDDNGELRIDESGFHDEPASGKSGRRSSKTCSEDGNNRGEIFIPGAKQNGHVSGNKDKDSRNSSLITRPRPARNPVSQQVCEGTRNCLRSLDSQIQDLDVQIERVEEEWVSLLKLKKLKETMHEFVERRLTICKNVGDIGLNTSEFEDLARLVGEVAESANGQLNFSETRKKTTLMNELRQEIEKHSKCLENEYGFEESNSKRGVELSKVPDVQSFTTNKNKPPLFSMGRGNSKGSKSFISRMEFVSLKKKYEKSVRENQKILDTLASADDCPGQNPALNQDPKTSFMDILLTLSKAANKPNNVVGAQTLKSPVQIPQRANKIAPVLPTVTPSARAPLGTTLAKLLSTPSGSSRNVSSKVLRHEEGNNVSQINQLNNKVPRAESATLSEGSLSLASLLAAAKVRDIEIKKLSKGRDEEVPSCQGCGKNKAQFVCAGCGNQWYCSRECQVKAWDEHSEVCGP